MEQMTEQVRKKIGNTKSEKVGTIRNNRKNIGKPIGKKTRCQNHEFCPLIFPICLKVNPISCYLLSFCKLPGRACNSNIITIITIIISIREEKTLFLLDTHGWSKAGAHTIFNWGLQRCIQLVWLREWWANRRITTRETRPPTTWEGKGVRLKMLSCTSLHK